MFVNVLHDDVGTGRRSRLVAVLVLGMHRSGTSSVAGALVRLGGSAPLHMMAPAPDNERGYWESPVVMALNDDILAAGDSGWADWRKFDCDRIDRSTAEALRARAKATLTTEFGDAGIPVIKDPRMCRLMRFWTPVFEEAGWLARAVLPLRSPLEVAWSLERRDGIDPSLGCLLWLRHVLDAEAETRGMTRAILDWSGFLGDQPAALGGVVGLLGLDWPRWREDGLAAVNAFISDDLRHCKADADELRVHPAIGELAREVYNRMLSLVDDPSDAWSLSRLDALRADFETAVALFDPAMRHFERALIEANRRLEQANLQLEQAHQRLEQANLQIKKANLLVAHVTERYAAQSSSAERGRFGRLRNSASCWTALETVRSSAATMTEGEANSRIYPDVEDVPRRERMLAPSESEVEQPYLPGIGDDEVEPTRAPKRRPWRWLVLLLALALVGLGTWRLVSSKGGHERRTAPEVQPVGAARIGAGDINETLSGLGTVGTRGWRAMNICRCRRWTQERRIDIQPIAPAGKPANQ